MTTAPPLRTPRLRAAVAAVLAAGAVGLGLFVTDDPRSGVEAAARQSGLAATTSASIDSAGQESSQR